MHVNEVAENVFHVEGSQVNWYLLRDGQDVTLIDCGYPADAPAVEESLRQIGSRPEEVLAILATHAHTDHIGAANHLHERYRTPLYLAEAEVPHARREHLQQVTLGQVIVRAWRPRVAKWARHAIAAGGTSDVAAPYASSFPAASATGALDLPGRPLPVPTPGHTSGHVAFLLPEVGAVLTGDALVTGHPTTSHAPGPQPIPAFFNHDTAQAQASLRTLESLDADLVLPGHGDPWTGSIASAVERARTT